MAQHTGINEFILIGLLWGESSGSPRTGISTRSITRLAVELADREGLDAVTTRRLAQEAGVSAMALYPHIGGRAELVELMLDHVLGSTYDGVTIPTEADWRERVNVIAEANWASCWRHPWITELTPGRPVPGPGASAKYEAELSAFDGIGLSDLEMEHTLTALLSLVQGTARAALALQIVRDNSKSDDGEWWSRIEPAITAAIGSADKFPTAARVSRTLGEMTGKANDPEGAYRHGIELFLDGIARRLEN